MRYIINFLPACVVLAHLAGTTLALPVLEGCPNDDSPSLIKRDAEAHISIPHVVASFDPQASESPFSPGGETHSLQKRAQPWEKVKKVFSSISNKVCGTGQIRREALENSILRQSNAGISQQEVIAPEGTGEDVIAPGIDLGENNQDQNQGQNNRVEVLDEEEDIFDIESLPVDRRRRQSIRPNRNSNAGQEAIRRFGTDEQIKQRISRLSENPGPMRIQDTEQFQARNWDLDPIPEQAMEKSLDSASRESLQGSQSIEQPGDLIPQESIQSGAGSGTSGTEVGDPGELRISLSESYRNPFVPTKKQLQESLRPPLWASDDLGLSDEEADTGNVGQNPVDIKPIEGEDPMRTGVRRYLAGQRGKDVVVVDKESPKQKKPWFIQRLFNGKGREPAPVKVVTGKPEPRPAYLGEINVQPDWIVNPNDVMAQQSAQLRDETRRLAEIGLSPEIIQRQTIQRKKVERIQPDRVEQKRREELYDQLFPDGDPGEIYVPPVEGQGSNNNLEESVDMLERAQIFTEALDQPQIRQNVLGQPQVIYPPNQQIQTLENSMNQAQGPQNPLTQAQVIQNPMNQAQVIQNPLNQAQELPSQMDQPQIQYPVNGIDVQVGSPAGSDVAVQDDGEAYVSFGEGNENMFGEDTADFARNLQESIRSQGWNLGVSRIGTEKIEYPPYVEGESREEDEYADLIDSPGTIRTETVTEVVANPNFSFAANGLTGSQLASSNSGGSQSQMLQSQQGQPPQ
ncbi:hypothetical protein TWF730_006694 [Orbilia blumenaviensis]|uniref:Uncharacterized protein n=1 Tax=Orbilia blumenaviensis TaxID=1796055 RepID=A0AAV9VHL2_9PEZI